MKVQPTIAWVCAAACLITAGCTTTKHPASLRERLRQTAKVALAEEYQDFSSPRAPIEFRPVTWLDVDSDRMQAWVNWLCAAEELGAIPGIGNLAKFLFVDRQGTPLASVHIVMWNCAVEVYPWRKRPDGKYVADSSKRWVMSSAFFRSEPFVRDVYAYMQVHMKDRLEEVRKNYAGLGFAADDLEAMLFRAEEKKPKPRKRLEGDDK